MVAANAFLAPITEELVFRGLLLPRMRSVFGKGDIFVNGLLFALYHLHQPWSMPAALIDGPLNQAYPTRSSARRRCWQGYRARGGSWFCSSSRPRSTQSSAKSFSSGACSCPG